MAREFKYISVPNVTKLRETSASVGRLLTGFPRSLAAKSKLR